ncbi:hypothetical protein IAG44_11785 [Streptomyces roseirectus]|uniref:Uncharacterized protein n=1 Tax=Streptomyces roseirectus TaxID=2768066 RepID=A0A7H0IB96_9ACTN|nr:hypothetical protein [Streptomyces roseirectus]QNP70062.1 hypothetical protein IAG44_11785 [Streptomyces roseirectus]
MTGLQAALRGLLGSGVVEALNLSASMRPAGPRRTRPAHHPRWIPVLLTTLALVLTCLTTAAAQGVIPTPWTKPAPAGGTVPEVRWTRVGEVRTRVGEVILAFSPADRNRLLAAGTGVEEWDVRDAARPRRAHVWRTPHPVTVLGVDPDRRTVVAASGRQLLSWEGGSGMLSRLESTPEAREVKAVRKRARSLDIVVRRSDSLTVLQEAGTTDDSGRYGFMTTAGFPQATHAAQFSPDGDSLALADDLGNVQLWDLSRNYEPTPRGRPLNTGARLPRALAFSPDAALLAVIGRDGAVRLWDIRHPSRPHPLGHPVGRPATSLAFSPDSRLVATADTDGNVTLWQRS